MLSVEGDAELGHSRGAVHASRRQKAIGVLEVVDREPDLLEIVLALRAGGRLANFLNGRQQEADQDGDDGDYDQQLDQRECGATACDGVHELWLCGVSVGWTGTGQLAPGIKAKRYYTVSRGPLRGAAWFNGIFKIARSMKLWLI